MTSTTDATATTARHRIPQRSTIARVGAAFAAIGPLLYLLVRQFPYLGERSIPCCDYAALDLGTTAFLHGEQYTGLYSRQGWRHPGPAPFIWNAPFRLVLGDSFASTRIAMAALAILAVALILWVLHRNLRTRAFLATCAVVMFWLMRFDIRFLIEPWNPEMAMLWVLATLACTWMALRSTSVRWLVAVVLTGSMAIQCHLSAAPVVVIAFVITTIAVRRHREDPRTRVAIIWAAIAGLAIWALPLWDLAFGERNLWHIVSVDDSGWNGGFAWASMGVDLVRIIGIGPARQGFAFGAASPFLSSHSLDLVTIAIALVSIALLIRLGRTRDRHPLLTVVAAVSGSGLLLTAALLAVSGGEYWPYVLMPSIALGPILLLTGAAAFILDLDLTRWTHALSSLVATEVAAITLLGIVLFTQVPTTSNIDDYTTPALRDITEQILDSCDALPDPALVAVNDEVSWTDAITIVAAISRCTDVRAAGHLAFIAGHRYELVNGEWPNVVIEPGGQTAVTGTVVVRNDAFEVLTGRIRTRG